ncbi:uncharacterized protein RCO7_14464 [Rhynchosporium graminicola]|uniref:Uncharacterized protein n=1 Tax=Rhynchosporium graminicola TaxID=2792576 RepID=A0A1E1KJA9_9HELO|nr:uncharacterized protein RCO7_14464 [Rhynchosporium commune]
MYRNVRGLRRGGSKENITHSLIRGTKSETKQQTKNHYNDKFNFHDANLDSTPSAGLQKYGTIWMRMGKKHHDAIDASKLQSRGECKSSSVPCTARSTR